MGARATSLPGRASPNPADPQGWGRAFAVLYLMSSELFWALVFGLVMYYGLRRFYPVVARGSGYATLALLAVMSGALLICQPLRF